MRSVRFVSAGAAALLAVAFAAAPTSGAALEGQNWVSAPNGLVGVQQTVIVRAPKARGSVATITFENSAAGTNSGQAVVNSQGFAYLPWTPNLPGTWNITASAAGSALDTATIAVAGMPTTTTLLVAGEVAENQTTTIVAQVKALPASITPSGTITVRNQSNAVVATGTLAPTATQGLASADLNWTPTPGQVTLTATYNPASTAFTSSTSTPQSPVIAGGQAVSLRMPPEAYVGVPETISAVIQPAYRSPLGGSVAFSLNIDGFLFFPMGGSQPTGGGIGNAQWTPGQTGIQTVGVEYASADFAINGRDTQVINVLPAPTPDTVTVTPAGSAAWAPGNVGILRQGNYVQLTPTSLSGNPVQLSTDGPCAADAADVTMLGPGVCEITATSIGNGGSLAPTSATYTVTIQAPAKKRR